jgi:CheY-like chemotaxis protein
MPTRGPIVIAEDDLDDCLLLEEIFRDLGVHNELKFFTNGQQLLSYLSDTQDQPFLIMSDINMPVMNGLELKNRINQDDHLKKKAIPFVFLTNSDSKLDLSQAYDLMVQGYFKKENSIEKLTALLDNVVRYWKECKHPNSDPVRPRH